MDSETDIREYERGFTEGYEIGYANVDWLHQRPKDWSPRRWKGYLHGVDAGYAQSDEDCGIITDPREIIRMSGEGYVDFRW